MSTYNAANKKCPKTLQEALSLTVSLPEHEDTGTMTGCMEIELIWSQIHLIYRAEGNANLVIALPQFRKILRLPKWQQMQSSEKDIESKTTEFNTLTDQRKGQ